MIHFVVHDENDAVGVVVVEGVKAGQKLNGWIMDQDKDLTIEAKSDIPIGHKLAIKAAGEGRHGDQVRHRTSGAWSRRSRWASMRTSTTSRPSGGERQWTFPRALSWATSARTAASAFATTSSSCRSTTCPTPPAEAVANNIKGTMAIPHPYGRLQFGADLDLHFRTLIGTGSNPNVAAVVVIGIEDKWTKKVVDGIAATGKPVAGFGIEQHGDHDTIMRASQGGAGIRAVGERAAAARSARSRTCGSPPSAASPTPRRAAAPIPPWATRSTSSTPHGVTLVLRRDHRAHRRRAHRRRALPQRRGARRSSCACSTATRR